MPCGLMWMSVCWRNLNSGGGSHVWQAVIGVSCVLSFLFRECSLYSAYTSGRDSLLVYDIHHLLFLHYHVPLTNQCTKPVT